MEKRIIFFDGECNLCNRSVQVVLKNDPHKKFRFASLQSAYAVSYLKSYGTAPFKSETFIVVENGQIFERSTAALRVAKQLKGLWPLLYVFIIVPRFIRDSIYNIIAKNRYKWFGSTNSCWLPTPAYSDRFIN
jgi:predicted DCC family thiol-disulfide oxidoreductase YuxK